MLTFNVNPSCAPDEIVTGTSTIEPSATVPVTGIDMQRLVPVNADAPLSLWAGERDDVALAELGAELAIKGPIQRLRAAIDG